MDFPEWAPPTLVNIYQDLYSRKESSFRFEREEKLLKALTKTPEMKRVWKMLYERRQQYPVDSKNPKSHGDGVMALSLFHAIEMAISATNKKFTARNEDVQKYQDIAKSARLLALKISESKFDSSLFEWLPVQAINTMLEKDINPDKAAGYFCLINDESEFHRKGGIYNEARYTDKKSGENVIENWRTMAGNISEFFSELIVTPQYPSVSEILKSLAEEADKQAKNEAERTRLADKSTTSKKTIFIRALYPYWLQEFGGPLKRTLATVCSVVLDEETTEDDVKNALM